MDRRQPTASKLSDVPGTFASQREVMRRSWLARGLILHLGSLAFEFRPHSLFGQRVGALRLSTKESANFLSEDMQHMKALEIARSFEHEDFVPTWWAKNNNVMTIAGAGVVSDVWKRLTGAPAELPFYDVRKEVRARDGAAVFVDFRAADREKGWRGEDIVVMLHGLESSTESPQMRRMGQAFNEIGCDVAAVSFRSCAFEGEIPAAPGAYHLGYTKDLQDVLMALARNPSYPLEEARTTTSEDASLSPNLYLSAFSLGANVCLKLLGEYGDGGDEAWAGVNLRGAAVSCVPFDPVACSPLLSDVTFNRIVYSGNFLKTLIPKAERQYAALGPDAFPPTFSIERVRRSKSIGDFDDAYIAPIYGFADKWDYYATQGCLPGGYLRNIRVPAHVINAKDDPFIMDVRLPTKEDIGEASLSLQYTTYGGHCGFLAPASQGGQMWLPRQLARFIAHLKAQKF